MPYLISVTNNSFTTHLCIKSATSSVTTYNYFPSFIIWNNLGNYLRLN